MEESTAEETKTTAQDSSVLNIPNDKFAVKKSTANLEDKSTTRMSENLCDSQHLLLRDTQSFRCLAQLLLSRSSLAKNRLYLFPPLDDPGIAFAFEFEEPELQSDEIGKEKYKKLCKELEIVPISRIVLSLETDTLDLKYYGLTNKQIKALSEALKSNKCVETLILQDNWLTPEMIQMISDMLVENTSIRHVSLHECRIGEEGAQKLGEALSTILTIEDLDLSFNELGDNGVLALVRGLSENISLKKLNLSHNGITEDSAPSLETILLENSSLEELDLAWNSFFTAQGNKRLFKAILQNDRLKKLNLAWNGIGISPAVRPLAMYMRKTNTLEELDLSNNRLSPETLPMVRNAAKKNNSLQVLKVGGNIYGPEQAHSLLTMVTAKKDSLWHLDISHMYINKDSKAMLKKARNMGKVVKIEGILGDYEIKGPNARKLIYDRCRYVLMKPKKAKARKDFGHFILLLPDGPLAPDDFAKPLKKLDKDLVNGLINLFVTRKKQIDCPELVKDYMTFYPDTKLPPPKPKKVKKGKKKGKKKAAQEEKEVPKLENPTDDGAMTIKQPPEIMVD